MLPSLDGAITFANPTNNDVSIVVPNGNSGIAVLTGTDTLAQNMETIDAPTPLGADYFVPDAGSGSAAADPVIVVAGVQDMLTRYSSGGPGSCTVVDNGAGSAAMPITVSAIAPVRDDTAAITKDDVLVLTKPTTGTAKLLVYSNALVVGCGSATTPVAPALTGSAGAGIDTGIDVTGGGFIKVFDDSTTPNHQYAVVASFGDKGAIALFDLGLTSDALTARVPTIVTTSTGAAGLGAVEVASIAGKDYVLAGYPDQTIDGVDAGQVIVSQIDTAATGSEAVLMTPPAMVLNDSQPDEDQTFGRSIAAVPFGSATDPIIVIAAHNEIFTYFETALYPDVRLSGARRLRDVNFRVPPVAARSVSKGFARSTGKLSRHSRRSTR